jgi:hypothetical protein
MVKSSGGLMKRDWVKIKGKEEKTEKETEDEGEKKTGGN